MKSSKKVLFLCTANSCRSQMAEGLINHFLPHKWQAVSAGISPSIVNPRAIQVMSEIGIDISFHRSKSVTEFLPQDDLDLVITVCDKAKENCPLFLKPVEQIHLGFTDPAPYDLEPDETALPKFRRLRDEMKEVLVSFLDKY